MKHLCECTGMYPDFVLSFVISCWVSLLIGIRYLLIVWLYMCIVRYFKQIKCSDQFCCVRLCIHAKVIDEYRTGTDTTFCLQFSTEIINFTNEMLVFFYIDGNEYMFKYDSGLTEQWISETFGNSLCYQVLYYNCILFLFLN